MKGLDKGSQFFFSAYFCFLLVEISVLFANAVGRELDIDHFS